MSIRLKPSAGFYLAVIPPAFLAIDLIYEQTVLSWERGPQMVGFTLLHTAGIVLLPLILASLLWCATTLLLPLFTRRWNLGNIAGAVSIAGLLGVTMLPYGFWVTLFADRIAKGPHAAEFLVDMAASGEVRSVRALVAQGVPVNASNRAGLRAIEAAANAQQEEARLLLETLGGSAKRF